MKKIQPTNANRKGFTLVELLLVIAVIAVLAGMSVGVMGSAQNDARVSATQARIAILEQILQTELETYEVRRPPVPEAFLIRLTNQIIATNGWNQALFLIHFRNIRRIINADLIRAEMPNGRGTLNTLGQFPSPELQSYLVSVGVPFNPPAFTPGVITPLAVSDLNRFRPAAVRRWTNWDFNGNLPDDTRNDEQTRTDSAELLYGLLTQIQFNGSSAVDALGSKAFRDSDEDGQLEIVDAWEEPISFQFLQENLTQPLPADVANGAWVSSNNVTDFEVSGNDITVPAQLNTMASAVRPVRADQIRSFFSSDNLIERDGAPVDFVAIQ